MLDISALSAIHRRNNSNGQSPYCLAAPRWLVQNGRMRILLTNDDGIHAPGLHSLYTAVENLGEVSIVAPDTQRSAIGHAITLYDPIKTSMVEKDGQLYGYAVGGTPADCVKLALCTLLKDPPNLIISGINLGPNAGISVLYSGTVSAATEGTILGHTSMAVSLCTFKDPIWETAGFVANRIATLLNMHGLPEGILLNVNVPNRPISQLRGIRITKVAPSRFVEKFDKRMDPQGNIYYWMDGRLECIGDDTDTDLRAIADGYVSVTALGLDRTNSVGQEIIRGWDLHL